MVHDHVDLGMRAAQVRDQPVGQVGRGPVAEQDGDQLTPADRVSA